MNLRRETLACIAVAIGASFSLSSQAQAIRECVIPQGAGGSLTLGPDRNVWFIDGAAGCGTTPPGVGGASCGLGRVSLDCTNYQHFPLPKGMVRRVATPSAPIPTAEELKRFGPTLGPIVSWHPHALRSAGSRPAGRDDRRRRQSVDGQLLQRRPPSSAG